MPSAYCPLQEDDEDLAGGRAAGGAGKGGHGASAEATNARRERDGELLELLVRTVIPRAVTLYLESGALVREGNRERCWGLVWTVIPCAATLYLPR